MLQLYHAAAGAGKTHVLVCAYLQLALQEPYKFRQILAITFTNKATQAMKDRILHHLYELAHGQENAVSASLQQAQGWSKQDLKKRAQELLSNLLHYYHYFAVGTVDSFFQQIIRAFAQEIGFQQGFTIELDQDHVLHTLIQNLIHTLPAHPDLQAWLVAFATRKLQRGQAWDFRQELTDLGTALLAEDLPLEADNASQEAPDYRTLDPLLKQLQGEADRFVSTLQQLGQQAAEAIERAGLKPQDFAYGLQGIAGFFEKIRKKKVVSPSKRVHQAQNSPTAWYAQNSPHAKAIQQLVRTTLAPLLEKILTFYAQHHTTYATIGAMQPLLPALGIATHLQAQLSQYRHQHATLLIRDATRFLQQIMQHTPADFVYEQVGERYTHFLIDEFQDLSTSQWDSLKLLVQNSLAEGNYSLVVGDTKQSIYRWRGGSTQLLRRQVVKDLGKDHVQEQYLPYNWRSKPHLIRFYNAFFPRAAQILTQHLVHQIQAEVADQTLQQTLCGQIQHIQTAYQSRQLPPPAAVFHDQGQVCIKFLPTSGSIQDEQKTALTHTIACIEQLQQQGFSAKDIGILVRNNQEAQAIVQALHTHQATPQAKPGVCYAAVTAADRSLESCPWISCLLAALQYLAGDHTPPILGRLIHLYQTYGKPARCPSSKAPADPAAYFEAAADPHQALAYLPEAFVARQGALQELPLPMLMEKLVSILGLHQAPALPYLQAFQDLVLDFARRQPGHIGHFLAWWQARDHRIGVPIQQHAIPVMTIHQAKGLEFGAVIVPFCTWRLDHNPHTPPVLWCRTTVAPFSELPLTPVYYSKSLRETPYAQRYYEEKWQTYLDHLNLLYVALTRAQDCLYVFAPQGKAPTLNTVADLLGHVLVDPPADPTNQDLDLAPHWRPAQQTWSIGIPAAGQPKAPEAVAQLLLAKPLEHDTHPHWVLTATRAAQEASGIGVHAVLAQVYQAADLPKVLARHVQAGTITTQAAETLLQQAAAWWKNPLIRQWFSGLWKVKTEAAMLLPTGQVIRPDRVMVKDQQAVVLDFKTGKQHPEHAQQVKRYAQQLRDMGYHPVHAYLLYTATAQLLSC